MIKKEMIAMLLAGGQGSRLGVLTEKVAKPAVAPTPAAAPAPAAVAAAPVQDDSEIIAVIAAAVAACGCSAEQIACIRRVKSDAWNVNARAEAISVRKECF